MIATEIVFDVLVQKEKHAMNLVKAVMEIFMNQSPGKRMSSAWRSRFQQKGNVFANNATKSDFERAPSGSSAIPTHPDGSQGTVQDPKNPNIRNDQVCCNHHSGLSVMSHSAGGKTSFLLSPRGGQREFLQDGREIFDQVSR